MLRKLIVFAITSGLAGKAWRAFRQHQQASRQTMAGRAPTRAQTVRRPVSDVPPV